jgi:hypothetical protein
MGSCAFVVTRAVSSILTMTEMNTTTSSSSATMFNRKFKWLVPLLLGLSYASIFFSFNEAKAVKVVFLAEDVTVKYNSSDGGGAPLQKRRLAIQSVNIGSTGAYSLFTQNHRSYCNKWGYDYLSMTTRFDNRSATWQKLPATIHAMRENFYDYIFWIDGDALFANCNVSLDGLVDMMEKENTTWLFSGDTLVINAGQMMWKNNEKALEILTAVDGLWFPGWEHGLQDNAAFAAYIAGARKADIVDTMTAEGKQKANSIIRKAYTIADRGYTNRVYRTLVQEGNRKAIDMAEENLQRRISFVPQRAINSYMNNYQNGDFVFHCAGYKRKDQCLEKFLKKTNRTMPSLNSCPSL